jgi:hypothetical protein
VICLRYNNMKLGLLFVISLTVLAATASTGAESPRGLSAGSSPRVNPFGAFTLSVCLTRERARFFLIQLNLREAGHSGTAGRHGGHAWIS